MHRERGTQAHIKVQYLEHNLKQFKKCHKGRVIAVVKADAYGHGLKTVVPYLSQCDAFAVATLDEAIELREINQHKRIILLEGVFNPEELGVAIDNQFDIVIHQNYQIDLLKQSPLINSLSVWLKIDTGMNRLGFSPQDAEVALETLQQLKQVDQIRLMTHFSSSDDKAATQTKSQIKLNQWVKSFGLECSFSNTAAVLNQLSDQDEWVRVGIGLFGISPLSQQWGNVFGLKPVMQLKAKIIATKLIKSGSLVGYGGNYQAPKDMKIGVVGIGYADGYPWTSKQSHVFIAGKKVPVIGRVSMDMLTVDLSSVETVETGHTVDIWGENLPIESVSHELDLIPYSLTCGITKRVKFYEIQ